MRRRDFSQGVRRHKVVDARQRSMGGDPEGLRVRAPSPLHTTPASSDVPDTARGAGAGRSKEGYMDRSPRPSHGYSSRTIARFAWPRVYSRPLSKRNRAVQRVLGMGVAVERVTYILAGASRCA